jgi:CRP/FNR family nitrogen fixation transcriptional regulator
MTMAFDISQRAARFPVQSRSPKASASWQVIAGGKSAAESDDATQALQRIGTKMRYARNETIFSEGDEAAYSYKVVSGAIRLCKHLADGRRQIAGFILPGEYCGLLPLAEHRFTAEATSDLVVIAYPQRQIDALVETMPSMRRRLAGFLTQRLHGMQDHVIMLGRQTAKERVVSFLLNLAQRARTDADEAAELPMSRQDIADYLGLTIETVCRVLSSLKRARLIALPSLHQVALINVEALETLAECAD